MTIAPSPNLSPNSPLDDEPSDWAKRQPTDGSFDVAGIGEWMARREMQKDSTLEPRVRATVRGLVGPSFSDDDLKVLEERALHAADITDALTLGGLQAGTPVLLSPRQKTHVDGLLNKIGDDDLARRARDAFGQAVKSGKIQVR